MKRFTLFLVAALLTLPLVAQNKAAVKNSNATSQAGDEKVYEKVYDESLNAIEQIDQAIEEAQASGRKVVCQVGGNWCPWCLRFADFITHDKEIADLIAKHYVYIHVNTSKANKNKEALVRLGNPGRFGYPVFVILDHDGSVLHIQSSAYLEQDKSYDRKKVLEFFANWTDEAIETVR